MKNRILFFISFFTLLQMTSCSIGNWEEDFKSYFEKGEVIYATKLKEIKTLPGNERLQIFGTLELSADHDVHKIIVEWEKNGEKIQRDFPYDKSKGIVLEEGVRVYNEVKVIVDKLSEGWYELVVYTINENNDKSVIQKVNEVVYGENFLKFLEARVLRSKSVVNGILELTFVEATVFQRNTEIVYFTKTNDQKTTKIVDNKTTSIKIDDINVSKPIEYRTFYVPVKSKEVTKIVDGVEKKEMEEQSLDFFESPWVTLKLN